MISIEDALRFVREETRLTGTESVRIEKAAGRILAEPLVADRDYPPFDRVTMDGYALRVSDLAALPEAARLPVAGVVYAGQEVLEPVAAGSCVRIMTGAALPSGADAVIKQEDVTAGQDSIQLHANAVRAGMNVAPRGEDARTGAMLLGSGVACTPAVIGLAATLGRASLQVRVSPRARILVTGDEVVPVGEPVGPVQIRASNAYVLAAFLQQYFIESEIVFLRDARPALDEAIRIAADAADLVLLSGGVSVGDRDFVPEALRAAGANVLFHGVDIKPGKPVLFARLGAATVFGLPGNPFSVQVIARLFVDAYLRRAFGMADRVPNRLPLAHERKKRGNRPEFFCVRYNRAPGVAALESVPHNGSGDITAGVGSDGLGLQPGAAMTIEPGELVEFHPW